MLLAIDPERPVQIHPLCKCLLLLPLHSLYDALVVLWMLLLRISVNDHRESRVDLVLVDLMIAIFFDAGIV